MLLHRVPAGHELPPGELDSDVGMNAFICSRPYHTTQLGNDNNHLLIYRVP